MAGALMAAEAVKLITGTGRSLLGRLSTFDLAEATWRELRILPDPARRAVERIEPVRAPEEACMVDAPEAINAPDLRELLGERSAGRTAFELVDVREAEESAIRRIPASRSAPLSRLRREAVLDGVPWDARVVLYCKAGPRSRLAAALLRDAGYARLSVLESGIDGWPDGG